jgi:hypothetical protein
MRISNYTRSLRNAFSRGFALAGTKSRAKATTLSRRLRYECLEERQLLADIPVTYSAVPLTLGMNIRNAIDTANSSPGIDTIVFTNPLFYDGTPETALLPRPGLNGSTKEILIEEEVHIVGPGSDQLIISGDHDGGHAFSGFNIKLIPTLKRK